MKNSLAYDPDRPEEGMKITDWAKEPTVALLQKDLKMAQPGRDAHVARVKNWLDIRSAKGKHAPKNVLNRSKVQPKLVRRQNEWRYSALSEPFLSSKKIFDLTAKTFEDEAATKQNELILNWQLNTKINKVKFIDQMVRTDVDEGTVAIRVGWARETKQIKVMVPVWQYSETTDPEYLEILQQAMMIKRDNPNAYLDLPPEMQAAVEYSLESGIPVEAEQVGEEQAEEEKVIKNQPTLDILNYENVSLDPSCGGDPEKAGFGVISFETSQAEMIKDGRYKNLKSVNWSGNTPLNTPDHQSQIDESVQFDDNLRKRVVAHEYWGLYDIHDNKELVPIVATWVGSTMVRMELNPYPDQKIPIVFIPYMPIKESVNGEPDAELLEDNQAILGAVTRGMIDLMGRSANSQTGVSKGALDPVQRSKFNNGHNYEFNPGHNPATSMHQHTFPEIPNSAITMLTLQNQEAEAMSGVKAFSGGLSGEAYGDVAAGIRGMLDASAKREMSILRRLAQGMIEVGRKITAMNAVFMSEEEVIRVTNKEYVKVRREDLAGNFDIEVDIATAEIDEAKAQDLSFMLQTMGNNMDFTMTQMILAEIATLKRMHALAEKIMAFQPTPDPIAEEMRQLENEKLKAEIRELDAQTQERLAKARETSSKGDLNDLDFIEQESGTKHMRDVDKIATQANSNQNLEVTKAILAPEEGKSSNDKLAGAVAFNTMSEQLTNAT